MEMLIYDVWRGVMGVTMIKPQRALPDKNRSWGGWEIHCPGVLKNPWKTAMSIGWIYHVQGVKNIHEQSTEKIIYPPAPHERFFSGRAQSVRMKKAGREERILKRKQRKQDANDPGFKQGLCWQARWRKCTCLLYSVSSLKLQKNERRFLW